MISFQYFYNTVLNATNGGNMEAQSKSMNEIQFSSMKTQNKYTKRSFVYDFLSSMRQKINDPLGKRKKVD